MNKFLSTSVVALAILIGTMSAADVVHAAACRAGYITATDGTSVNADGSPCDVGAGSGTSVNSTTALSCPAGQTEDLSTGNCVSVAADGTVTQMASPAAQDAAAKTVTEKGGDPSDGYASIMAWIASLFAWLVGAAAITLDYAVYYTIIRMGDYVHNLSAIGITWRIFRDIGNIALIFGFLAIGISTILNTERLGWGKKMLPMLLVAAVFINFSLFFSEAVIDMGNIFATQFFTQINGGEQPTADYLSKSTIGSEGISNAIMAQVGLTNIYTQGRTNTLIFKGGNTWVIGFMSILLFIVTAFVMFSLAFILIARFVFLIFLIILAPLGFAGLAIPQLAARAKWWWNSLFEQTITAPVLLLLLYIALAVITDTQFLTGLGSRTSGDGGPSWTGFIDGSLTGFGSLLLTFLIAMGLLLLVVIVSKNLSAFGAAGATKLAGKLSFGAAAWGVNRTVGRGAYFASRGLRQNKTFNKLNAATGRVFSGALDKVATGSMDVRGIAAAGGLKGLGIDAGGPIKGFTEARKLNIKAHEEEAKRIEEAHKDALRNTAEDDARITEKVKAHGEATTAKQKAQEAKEAAEKAKQGEEKNKIEQEAEAARLAEELRKDPYLKADQAFMQKHDEAQKKATESAENVKTATANFTKATEALNEATAKETAAEKAKTEAEGAAEKRMKENIKQSKIAYAEGINQPLNPINFVMYGPDSSAAARKIIKEAKTDKSKKEKLAELAKEVSIEEEKDKEKNSSSEGSGGKKEEAKTVEKH